MRKRILLFGRASTYLESLALGIGLFLIVPILATMLIALWISCPLLGALGLLKIENKTEA